MRARSEINGVGMAYFRAERIKIMAPLVRRCNKEGMSIPEAAKYLGWSESTVRNWIKILCIKWKLGRRRNVYRFDKSGWEKAVVEGQAKGLPIYRIAAQLGTGHWNVSRFMKDNGLRKPNRKNRLMP
jgi:DNA-binding NarL/FixJ family response regulator